MEEKEFPTVSGASGWIRQLPFYYGWVQMVVAALAMVGTLPGRTQGLGLVTEPLMKEMHFSPVQFAEFNLWATLIGALFAIGIGRAIDRFGSRIVLTVLALLLGGVVVWMAKSSPVEFPVLLTLTRGLGQSALSVASLALVGKWFVRRINLAMAIYSVVLSIGFMVAFPWVGAVVKGSGWRVAWGGIGWTLLFGLAPLVWLLARRSPEACGLPMDGVQEEKTDEGIGSSLWQALATPAFWVIGVASALYGLIASGIALFNEAILRERGFSPDVYYATLVVTAMTSLVGNFLGGWLTANRPLYTQHRLMAVAMFLLMASLLALTQVRTLPQVLVLAVVLGIAGGFIIVIFFAYWAAAFGRAHLGLIQGVAQALTVVASAVGPLLLAWFGPLLYAQYPALHSAYAGMFYVLALVVGLLGLASWFVPAPRQPS